MQYTHIDHLKRNQHLIGRSPTPQSITAQHVGGALRRLKDSRCRSRLKKKETKEQHHSKHSPYIDYLFTPSPPSSPYTKPQNDLS
ncbi:hypothetical protein MAP00_008375 [Monascus purpureus]|nr:hypothetical protein MAP00_008375 [Monascus purpureus]